MHRAVLRSRVGIGLLAFAVLACDRPPAQQPPSAATLTALGRSIFFDTTLSASGRMACSSCHDPAHDWGPPNARAVQLGGPASTTPGVRAVPSLMYQQDTPPFSEHFRESDGDDSGDQGPTGGRAWDGRVSSTREQAAIPLLSSFEMANRSRGAVVARLRASSSAPAFRAAFGPGVFDDSLAAWRGLVAAFDVFQQSPTEFYPYTSKYDAFLRGQTELTQRERRGLALFNDRNRGNCAQCHPSAMKRGAFPQFTDRGFIALGVPRNAKIPANADPGHFDLGLCGPLRTDLARRADYCAMFKTPSLRNVARRTVFFHNGVFTRLEDVLRFYVQRDIHPERFYPRGRDGGARGFDDIPPAYQRNVTVDPPFNRHAGDRPALSESEMADVIAFLGTLTDGFRPR